MSSGRLLAGLSLVALMATACSATSAPAAASASRGQPAAATPACTLPLASVNTLSRHNVSNPDTESDYWIIVFKVQDGLRITLSGRYPDSRYFSLEVYNSRGLPFSENGVSSWLTDYRIAPDPGSVNPWQHQAPPGGRFTVTVRSGVTPGQVNTLPLAPAGTAAGTYGRIYFRAYVAHGSPSQLSLPAATVTLNGVSRPLPACTAASIRSAAGELSAAGQLSAADVAKVHASLSALGGIIPFIRLPSHAAGTPDSDAGYLTAFVSPPHNGDVVVIRAKAPTAPSGSHPSPWPARGTDVQYWSLCNDVYISPVPVVINHLTDGNRDYGCRYDSQVKLDRYGYYTFVVGTEAQRAAIERIPGATFLPFSAAHPADTHALYLRNIVPSPGFAEAIQNVPANESPTSAAAVMGPYYPRAAFCSLATLAHDGPDACFARSSSPLYPSVLA
jgi:hypothetical protein